MLTIGINRDTTNNGVSIGTGLLLETLFNAPTDRYDKEKKPITHDISNWNIHYYNVYTLVRNIFSSFAKEDKPRLMSDKNAVREIMNILIRELYILESLYVNTSCKPILYLPDYNHVIKNCVPKVDKGIYTQLAAQVNFIGATIGEIRKRIQTVDIPIDIHVTDHLLPITKERVLITTNIVFDLCNVERRIKNLTLLESNTGAVKTKSMFSTKLKFGDNDLSRLPFIEEMTYIFGDSFLTSSYDIKVKRQILKDAIDKKWTPMSDPYTVRTAIAKHTDKNGKKMEFKRLY